mgnify:CR=1 FL=1
MLSFVIDLTKRVAVTFVLTASFSSATMPNVPRLWGHSLTEYVAGNEPKKDIAVTKGGE